MEQVKAQQKQRIKTFLLPSGKTTKPLSLFLIFSTLFLTLGFYTPKVFVANVSAQVLARLSQSLLQEEKILIVTLEDIAKGYVDIQVGTTLQVKTNARKDGYFLRIGMKEFVRKVMITFNGRTVEVPFGGGLVHLVSSSKEETLEIAYRLFITDNTDPGFYSWPISISASLL